MAAFAYTVDNQQLSTFSVSKEQKLFERITTYDDPSTM